ncbi:MAG: type II secretion system F family protein [Candidatus Omnitrophota bacterium]
MILGIFVIFCAVALVAYALIPSLYASAAGLASKREKKLVHRMERLVPRAEIKKRARILVLSPLVLAAGFYLFFPAELRFFGIVLGVGLGLVLPSFYTKYLINRNRSRFDNQLIDALMIMSSSFRGGLSLIQALEAVVEEMPNPINQEFGTVLGENKMGVSLDEALNHLYNRMPSPAMQQMITAILLARETGGNLPVIFTRIVNTIRERKKIQQNIETLTLQGKIQGVVMAILPIGFGFVVYSSNPRYMDLMIKTDMGRAMLMYAIISEMIGAFMIWKISSIKDF